MMFWYLLLKDPFSLSCWFLVVVCVVVVMMANFALRLLLSLLESGDALIEGQTGELYVYRLSTHRQNGLSSVRRIELIESAPSSFDG